MRRRTLTPLNGQYGGWAYGRMVIDLLNQTDVKPVEP